METNVGISKCWLLYQANSKLEILDLSGWHFCLTFRMLTPQPLSGVLEATACIFLYPQRVQRVSSYSWKFAGTLKIKDTYVLFLNEFLFDCLLELFCLIGYFYWDWSLFNTQLIPRKIRKICHQSLPTRKKAQKRNHLCNKRYIIKFAFTTKARLVVKSKTNFWIVLFHFTFFASNQTVWLASKTSFYPEMCFLGTASPRIVHHSNKYFFMSRLLQATFLKHHEKFTSTSR